VSCVTLIFNKQKMAFSITILDVSLRIIALLVGGFLQNYMVGFILMSASCSLLMLFTLWWFYSLTTSKASA
jgi:hypothetical protein